MNPAEAVGRHHRSAGRAAAWPSPGASLPRRRVVRPLAGGFQAGRAEAGRQFRNALAQAAPRACRHDTSIVSRDRGQRVRPGLHRRLARMAADYRICNRPASEAANLRAGVLLGARARRRRAGRGDHARVLGTERPSAASTRQAADDQTAGDRSPMIAAAPTCLTRRTDRGPEDHRPRRDLAVSRISRLMRGGQPRARRSNCRDIGFDYANGRGRRSWPPQHAGVAGPMWSARRALHSGRAELAARAGRGCRKSACPRACRGRKPVSRSRIHARDGGGLGRRPMRDGRPLRRPGDAALRWCCRWAATAPLTSPMPVSPPVASGTTCCDLSADGGHLANAHCGRADAPNLRAPVLALALQRHPRWARSAAAAGLRCRQDRRHPRPAEPARQSSAMHPKSGTAGRRLADGRAREAARGFRKLPPGLASEPPSNSCG